MKRAMFVWYGSAQLRTIMLGRFIDAIMELFARNDCHDMVQFAELSFDLMVFNEGTPGVLVLAGPPGHAVSLIRARWTPGVH